MFINAQTLNLGPASVAVSPQSPPVFILRLGTETEEESADKLTIASLTASTTGGHTMVSRYGTIGSDTLTSILAKLRGGMR